MGNGKSTHDLEPRQGGFRRTQTAPTLVRPITTSPPPSASSHGESDHTPPSASPTRAAPEAVEGSTKPGPTLRAPTGGRGSLASRRLGNKVMAVDTRRAPKKRIRQIDSFTDAYRLGSEVMPSCHRGMQVLHATHLSSNTHVVVKVRTKRDSFRSRNEETEWREATEFVMNLQKGQTIAKLHEVLEDRAAYYVVMEKVEGLDLFESLSGDGPMSMSEIKQVVRQVLMALVDLHTSGAIHKDLKLENVMVERSPAQNRSTSRVHVKLIDFDTVEEYCPKTPKSAKDVLGTDQYISQEAYDGNYSPASDIFAVGVIAYKLLTGRFPFDYQIFNDEAGENWVGSPKMKEIRDKVKNFDIRWDHRIFLRHPSCVDLPRRMLAANQEDRPTAQEALDHPWLAQGQPSRRSSDASASARLPNSIEDAAAAD